LSCEECGSCCVQYGGNDFATEKDIKRWIHELRLDILQFCEGWNEWCFEHYIEEPVKVISYLTNGGNYVFWRNPLTKEPLGLCPFLRKKYGKSQFECLIYNTRPKTCREYFCKPNDMKGFVKKSFRRNFKEYREKRKYSHSIKIFGGLISQHS